MLDIPYGEALSMLGGALYRCTTNSRCTPDKIVMSSCIVTNIITIIMLTNIINTVMILTNNTNSIVTLTRYRCNEGVPMSGSESLYCDGNTWNGSVGKDTIS